MTPRRIGVALVLVGVLALVAWAFAARAPVREALFSEKPMETYLAQQIVLEKRFGARSLPPEAAASSQNWIGIVDVIGTDPRAPDGCDVYLRYYVGHPGLGGDEPAVAEAGYAVARVEDPDEPSGPVAFRFPRDGSLWAVDMREMMPERLWRSAKPGSFDDLAALWRLKARGD
jgi:hypothetical protein